MPRPRAAGATATMYRYQCGSVGRCASHWAASARHNSQAPPSRSRSSPGGGSLPGPSGPTTSVDDGASHRATPRGSPLAASTARSTRESARAAGSAAR